MKRFLLWIISVALGVALLLAAVMGVSYAFTTQGGCPDAAAQFGGPGAGDQRLLLAGAAAGRPAGQGVCQPLPPSRCRSWGTLYTAHPDITLPDWASYTTLTIQTAVGQCGVCRAA